MSSPSRPYVNVARSDAAKVSSGQICAARSSRFMIPPFSSKKPLLVVPDQRCRGRAINDVLRKTNRRAMQRVVIASVLEFLFDPATNEEVVIRRHGHVPGVKELVNVRSKQDAVTDRMLLHIAIFAYVRGFECR